MKGRAGAYVVGAAVSAFCVVIILFGEALTAAPRARPKPSASASPTYTDRPVLYIHSKPFGWATTTHQATQMVIIASEDYHFVLVRTREGAVRVDTLTGRHEACWKFQEWADFTTDQWCPPRPSPAQ